MFTVLLVRIICNVASERLFLNYAILAASAPYRIGALSCPSGSAQSMVRGSSLWFEAPMNDHNIIYRKHISWFNTKISFYQFKKPHCGDRERKTQIWSFRRPGWTNSKVSRWYELKCDIRITSLITSPCMMVYDSMYALDGTKHFTSIYTVLLKS